MEAAVRDASVRVAEQLGPLQRELSYSRALAAELRARGHVVSVEHPVPVSYVASDGFRVPIGTERADLVVDNKMVIEAKIGAALPAAAEIQAGRYCATLGLETGFVVAFSREGGAQTWRVR